MSWPAALVALVVIVWIFAKYTAENQDGPSVDGGWRIDKDKPSNLYHWEAKGNRQYLAGCDYKQAEIKHAIARVSKSNQAKRITTIAHLIHDNKNPHDNKAIRVEVQGIHIGYLPRAGARTFRRRLGAHMLTGQTTTCNAELWGGYINGSGRWIEYGASLDIKPI